MSRTKSRPSAPAPVEDDRGQRQRPGRLILVIEDEPQMLLGLRDNLELEGYEVQTASDGEQGLVRAAAFNPDLVILDMMMPKRSGFLVLEKLRRTREAPVRVIMITAPLVAQ